MNRVKQEYPTPEFLLCELPIKDGTYQDNRNWVYHVKSLSLIEFVSVDQFIDYNFPSNDYFVYTNIFGEDEHYVGYFVQNNCELTGYESSKILEEAKGIYFEFITRLDQSMEEDD